MLACSYPPPFPLRASLSPQFIEVYVTKVAPAKTPSVVGKLLDLDADEDFVKGLLTTVGELMPALL